MILSFYNKSTNKFTGAQSDESLDTRNKHIDMNQGAILHDESFNIVEDVKYTNSLNGNTVLQSDPNFAQVISAWETEAKLLDDDLVENITFSESLYKTITPEQISEGEAQYNKLLRSFNEENLTVTSSNGNVFDANKHARQNISDAILASELTGIFDVTWRLADNTEVSVNVTELKEVQVLALQAYANLIGIS